MHTKRAAKKSGKLRKLRRGFILLVLLIAIVVLVIYTLNSVGPVIVSVSEARIRALTTSAVNSAIFEVMTEPTKYSELITIQKDDAGNITLIEANAMVINNLAREMAKEINTIGVLTSGGDAPGIYALGPQAFWVRFPGF